MYFTIFVNIFYAFAFVEFIEGASLKILLDAPLFAYGHSIMHNSMARELANAGHNVTMLIVHVNPYFNYNGPKNVRIIKVDRPKMTEDSMSKLNYLNDPFSGHQNMFLDGLFADWGKIAAEVCEELTSDEQLMLNLKNEAFDVGIAEEHNSCAYAIFHHANIKTKIMADATTMHLRIAYYCGISLPPSYVPNMAAASIDAPYMSFFNRARAYIFNWMEIMYTIKGEMLTLQPILQKNFGADFPPIHEIIKNTSLIFINQFEQLDMPHLTSAKIVNVGGINLNRPKNLESNIQQIMDNAVHGVICVSFGSTQHAKKNELVHGAMIDTFLNFPNYTFIWSLKPSPSIERKLERATNIFAFKWVDQASVLFHPKVKLFITHCGVNGYQEAALAGKPMVGIPLYADQLYNCAAMKYHNLGVYVNILDIANNLTLSNAIVTVLRDYRYANNALLMSQKLALLPFSPAEKLVKNIEYAAHFENLNELNLPYYNEIPPWKYHSYDVLLAGIGTIVFLAFSFVILPIQLILSTICFPPNKRM